MNTGVISARYARALLLLVQQSGRGEQVFEQARQILSDPSHLPAELEPDLAKLVLLMRNRGRDDHLKFTLTHFTRLWCEAAGARLVHLRTAVPSPGLEKRIAEILEKGGNRVIMDSTVDPSLEGGFVFEVDGYMLDASVRTQMERIRREFIEKNNRIV